MNLPILGWGTSLPTCFLTQSDAAQLATDLWGVKLERPAALTALYRRSGVAARYSVLLQSSTNGRPAEQKFYEPAVDLEDRGPTTASRLEYFEREATDLAARACRQAISEAGIEIADIDHLITVSCSGFSAPGVDIGLMDVLGLQSKVTRTNVGFMGCHGALNGLRIGSALAAQSPESRILLCCVELCSLHQQYTSDPQQLVANALFADGAGALVLGGYSRENSDWQLLGQNSYLIPETRHLMSWKIGDHGFEMSLSPEVPAVIEEQLRPWLSNWLSRFHLSIEEIRGWGIHPGGPRVLTACADGLQFERQLLKPSQDVLSEFGNMSSPTVLFILDRLRKEFPDGPCVGLAFGPGLTIEAALFGS